MQKPQYSLKKRLMMYTSLFIILMGCLLVIAAYRIALEETNEILDAQMRNLAERVAKFNPQPIASQFDQLKHYHEEDLFVDVWTYGAQNHLSHQFKLLVKPVKKAGFYQQNTLNGVWQTYVIPLKSMQIQVSQQKSVRQHLALELAMNMFLPYILIMPLAIWGLSLIIRRSFAPIDQFKQELSTREVNELTPIQAQHYPIEIIPSINEINSLFERISKAQHEQQQFVADAAHELRTPITALNLQTQILMQKLPHEPALIKLNQGLARMQHLIHQLLNLAKQDALNLSESNPQSVEVDQVIVQCVEELIDVAIHKEIDLGITQLETITIQSFESSLHSIIYNLIENAIKYTPSQGLINVSCFKAPDCIFIVIEDSGSGIAPELYDQILKRFYRVHQHLEIGSGLGLSIVDKATQRIGGQLHFAKSEALSGLKATVKIPL